MDLCMQKLKGAAAGLVVLGLIMSVIILTLFGYRIVSEIVNSKAKLNFQISLEQDYSGTEVFSLLSLISSKTKGLTYSEVIGNVFANNTDMYNHGLQTVKTTIKKIVDLEQKNISLSVKYGDKSIPITEAPEGDAYKVDIALPGGERGELRVGKIV